MRIAILAALLTTTAAQADNKLAVKVQTPTPRTLEASEVKDHMKHLDDAIGHCYMAIAADVKGAGHLDITLSIHRTGSIEGVQVATPKLSTRMAKQIEACVRPLVADLTFPARRAPTTAVVPFFYQHTAAPGSGPQYSCWKPEGCH
jgi:hypothetical protein